MVLLPISFVAALIVREILEGNKLSHTFIEKRDDMLRDHERIILHSVTNTPTPLQ